nr:hypothetical protein CFP56_47458 [Quercus suber]
MALLFHSVTVVEKEEDCISKTCVRTRGAFNRWKREVYAPSKEAKGSILMIIMLQKLNNGNNFALCKCFMGSVFKLSRKYKRMVKMKAGRGN